MNCPNVAQTFTVLDRDFSGTQVSAHATNAEQPWIVSPPRSWQVGKGSASPTEVTCTIPCHNAATCGTTTIRFYGDPTGYSGTITQNGTQVGIVVEVYSDNDTGVTKRDDARSIQNVEPRLSGSVNGMNVMFTATRVTDRSKADVTVHLENPMKVQRK